MKRILTALLLLVSLAELARANDASNILLLLSHVTAKSGWGTTTIGPQDRPEHAWLNQFDNVNPIPVTNPNDPESQCLARGACVLTVNKLQLSQTIFLSRPHTKLLGVDGNKITFINSNGQSFIELETGIHDVVIEGLNIDGESRNHGNNSVFGIMVNGQTINQIALINNNIHHLHSDEDAHGIAVYGTGTNEATAISNVIIDNNNVHNMRTGSSESIAINGNVKNWEVKNNTVSHINNIAIDAIGGEGTVTPVQNANGRVLPAELDAARYGFIENNTVTDMTTLTNPSYGSEHSWAGGIYVDGAHHLLIAGNRVTSSEWAYDIGAENCVKPRHIMLKDNIAASSYYGDFYVGGYAAKGFEEDQTIECDPRESIDDKEGHGYVLNVTVKNNSFTTPSGSAHFVNTVEFGNRIRKTIIIHPGVAAQHPDGVVTEDENSIRTQ